jgi:hypothetical protein
VRATRRAAAEVHYRARNAPVIGRLFARIAVERPEDPRDIRGEIRHRIVERLIRLVGPRDKIEGALRAIKERGVTAGDVLGKAKEVGKAMLESHDLIDFIRRISHRADEAVERFVERLREGGTLARILYYLGGWKLEREPSIFLFISPERIYAMAEEGKIPVGCGQ